ncbi:MAG: zf-HC2 domain-containing protein [Dehalobacterium sp.]
MRIPCELAEDLMPLVKDGIASESSNRLLNEHISECQACKKLFEEQSYLHDEDSIPKVRKLKRMLFAAIALLITIGSLIGYFLSSANTPMPIALLIVGVLSLIPLAIILGKGKPDKMSRFFYGKAIGTVILFALLGIFLLLRYVFGFF